MKAAGKFLKRRALSLFFLRRIRQSTMRTTALVFAAVRFAFLIQGAISNAPLRSTRRIESYPLRVDCLGHIGGNRRRPRSATVNPPRLRPRAFRW